MFLNETIRMLRLGLLKIIPLRPGIVTEIWRIIKKKHNICKADTIQIAPAKHIRTSEFYTVNEKALRYSEGRGVKVVCIAQSFN